MNILDYAFDHNYPYLPRHFACVSKGWKEMFDVVFDRRFRGLLEVDGFIMRRMGMVISHGDMTLVVKTLSSYIVVSPIITCENGCVLDIIYPCIHGRSRGRKIFVGRYDGQEINHFAEGMNNIKDLFGEIFQMDAIKYEFNLGDSYPFPLPYLLGYGDDEPLPGRLTISRADFLRNARTKRCISSITVNF